MTQLYFLVQTIVKKNVVIRRDDFVVKKKCMGEIT